MRADVQESGDRGDAGPGSYDLLIQGGEVVDVGGGHRGRLDVAVKAGCVAAVEQDLSPDLGRCVVDASGKVVTPGLVDMHTHVFPDATHWGIDPDTLAWCSGVTTWVDAGSAGAFGLRAFRSAIRSYAVRVPTLLNISAIGLVGGTGENRNIDNCDVDLAIATIAEHRDIVVGVKVRMDRNAVGDQGLEPLRRARRVADECRVPIMVHISYGPPSVTDVLDLLRPGDVVTHCASGVSSGMLTDEDTVSESVADAYRSGVLFDIGHGAGGFSFDVLDRQLAAGLEPHTVSSDLHARSIFGPAFDLPTTMNKLLASGLPLDQVIAGATCRPAEILGLPAGVGSLVPGGAADIAVFALEEGDFEWGDAHGVVRRSTRRLVNEATYLAGHRMPPRLPAPPMPWVALSEAQHSALRTRERTIRQLLTTPLVEPAGLDEQFPIQRT